MIEAGLEAERNRKRGFIEWDQAKSRLTWDDPIEFEGEVFEAGGGQVVWRRSAWWMTRWARRKQR